MSVVQEEGLVYLRLLREAIEKAGTTTNGIQSRTGILAEILDSALWSKSFIPDKEIHQKILEDLSSRGLSDPEIQDINEAYVAANGTSNPLNDPVEVFEPQNLDQTINSEGVGGQEKNNQPKETFYRHRLANFIKGVCEKNPLVGQKIDSQRMKLIQGAIIIPGPYELELLRTEVASLGKTNTDIFETLVSGSLKESVGLFRRLLVKYRERKGFSIHALKKLMGTNNNNLLYGLERDDFYRPNKIMDDAEKIAQVLELDEIEKKEFMFAASVRTRSDLPVGLRKETKKPSHPQRRRRGSQFGKNLDELDVRVAKKTKKVVEQEKVEMETKTKISSKTKGSSTRPGKSKDQSRFDDRAIYRTLGFLFRKTRGQRPIESLEQPFLSAETIRLIEEGEPASLLEWAELARTLDMDQIRLDTLIEVIMLSEKPLLLGVVKPGLFNSKMVEKFFLFCFDNLER